MKPIDYIIIAVIAITVIAIAVYIVRKKIKGEKIGCGCGCQSCPHAGTCGGANSTCEKETVETEKDNGGKHDDQTI